MNQAVTLVRNPLNSLLNFNIYTPKDYIRRLPYTCLLKEFPGFLLVLRPESLLFIEGHPEYVERKESQFDLLPLFLLYIKSIKYSTNFFVFKTFLTNETLENLS